MTYGRVMMKLGAVLFLVAFSLGRSALSGSSGPPGLSGISEDYHTDNPDLSILELLGPAVDAMLPAQLHPGPSPASSYSLMQPGDQPHKKRESQTTPADVRPTPEPTGESSASTTIHIIDEHDFALLLPDRPGELISDAESDGVAFCTPDSADAACSRRVAEGFIRAAAVTTADDGSYIQVTGCLDVSKSSLDASDSGGQFDVRFPNGAQCTFGGYGASFIQLVEPAANRFCVRCCSKHGDQINCNSHQDRSGCQTAIPGTYAFPALGVTCEE